MEWAGPESLGRYRTEGETRCPPPHWGSTPPGRLPCHAPACASRHLGASTPPRPAACLHVRPQETACWLAPSIRPGPTRQPLRRPQVLQCPGPPPVLSCPEEEHGSRHLLGRREFQFLAPARPPSCLQRVLPPPPEPAPLLPNSWPGDVLMFSLCDRGLHTRSFLSCSCLPSPREGPARLRSRHYRPHRAPPTPAAPRRHPPYHPGIRQRPSCPPGRAGGTSTRSCPRGRRPLSSRCSVRVLLASPPF